MTDGQNQTPLPPESSEFSLASTPSPGRLRRTIRFVRRHRRGIGLVLVLVAGLLAGTATGWALRDRRSETATTPAVIAVNRPITPTEARIDATIAVPNVLGLGRDDARQGLVDSGADPSLLSFFEVPSAGQAGVVVVQTPPPGAPAPGEITLGLSVEATVPEVAGLDLAGARDAFDELGARVQITRQYDAAASEGTVISTSPAAGQPLPPIVALEVAAAPTSAFLTAVRSEGRCNDAANTAVNGTSYDTALRCATSEDLNSTVWLVNRKVTLLETTIGIPDDSDPGSTIAWSIQADGIVVDQGTVTYGTATDVVLDLTGVLRLQLDTILVELPDNVGRPDVALVDPLLVGGPDEIAALLSAQ